METTTPKFTDENSRVFRPSFFQCLPVFLVPLALFLFWPLGVGLFYVLLFFWLLETSFIALIWIHLATTLYVLKSDRIEIRSGLLSKRIRSIPLDQITNITCRQNPFQRLFKVGDIFIDIAGGGPGGTSLEVVLAGVECPLQVAQGLFVLKKEEGK